MLWLFAALPFALSVLPDSSRPFMRQELIMPPEALHNHGSCLVETPKGQILACWYRGSGERQADDVQVLGARLNPKRGGWTKPFTMQETPGFPDTNPCMIVDPQKRLWLFWSNVLDNHWETALTKFKISTRFDQKDAAPVWDWQEVLHLKPGAEFAQTVERDLEKQWSAARPFVPQSRLPELNAHVQNLHTWSKEKLPVRLGWMTRAHPLFLESGRLLLPLYSDRFDFSLIAYTDDRGKTWKTSEPIVGAGNVQPSLVRRKDGTLVAYFRDNGPPPQRVLTSESKDEGVTWTQVHDTELWDPGAGLEAIVLQSGRWVLVNNNTEDGRHQLALTVSEDEGKTWFVAKYLERDTKGADAGSYSYPSLIQARDGTIHASYSYRPNKANSEREGKGETIKHVQFNEAWLLEGARK